MRAKVFKYFNFAFASGRVDFKNIGECTDACSKWKQQCCASMIMSRGRTREFEFACINSAIAGGGIKMDLADFNVEIKCNNVWANALFLKTAIGSFLATMIAFYWKY